MPALYLTEQGSTVRRIGQRLVVEKDGTSLLEVPVFKLETVILVGNVGVTTPALNLLFRRGVELAFLTTGGQLKGRLVAEGPKNASLRLAQYKRYHDREFRLELASRLVQAKIEGGIALIRAYRANHPCSSLRQVQKRLEEALSGLKKGAFEGLESLRGLEGSADRLWFEAFALMLRQPLGFQSRGRRPPPDPVNATLSLGYVLVCQKLTFLLEARGLDPYIGFYHGIRHGRPALALDLLEVFRRPVVDRLALTLFNKRILQPSDFSCAGSKGYRLSEKGLRTFLSHFDAWLRRGKSRSNFGESYHASFRNQIESLTRHIVRGEPFNPFGSARS